MPRSGGAITANPGANPVTHLAQLDGQDDTSHSWQGNRARTATRTRASTAATRTATRCSSARRATAGAVALVRTSMAQTRQRRPRRALRQPPLRWERIRLQQQQHVRSVPDRRHRQRAQDGSLHDAPPRRPAGEPDAAVRSRRAPGPGVQGLPDRLHAVVRREHSGPRRGGSAPRSTAPTPASGSAAARCRWARTRPGTTGSAFSPPRACRPVRSATTSPSRPTTATTSRTTRASSSTATTTGTTTASPGLRRLGPAGRRLALPARRQPLHRPLPVEQGADGRR